MKMMNSTVLMVSSAAFNVIIHFVKDQQVEHANRWCPLTSTDYSADDTHDHKLVQYRLNQIGFRKQVKLLFKDKMN